MPRLAPGDREGPEGTEGPEGRAGGSPFGVPADGPGRRRRSAVITIGAVAVAAAAVATVLGIFLVHAHARVSNLQSAEGLQASSVAAALATPGHRVVDLHGPSSRTQLAQMVVVPGGRGYLISSSLPSLGDGKTYQLWAIEGDQPISLGLLGGAPSETAFTMAGATSPSRLSITAEPAGGSVVPTGPIIATGTV